jgi:hypothetical protein
VDAVIQDGAAGKRWRGRVHRKAQESRAHSNRVANGNGGFASHSTRRPTTLPRIGIMKASNRHVVREFKPSKKKVLRRKRKLTRDR